MSQLLTAPSIRSATPTEYKKVVFRSKSEAVFARAMELLGISWEYEPPAFMVDEWVPDFWLVPSWKNENEPKIHSFLCEYKPKPTTQTYQEELARRFLKLDEQVLFSFLLVIVTCTPFDKSSERSVKLLNTANGTWVDMTRHWFFFWRHLDTASSYRFDLEASQ